MDFLKKNKAAIGGGVALVLLLYVYLNYFSGGADATLSESSVTSPLSADILVTLQSIHSITLDNAIFSDPVFISLSDFGVTIPAENVGRRNPFAPFTAGKTSTTTVKLPRAN